MRRDISNKKGFKVFMGKSFLIYPSIEIKRMQTKFTSFHPFIIGVYYERYVTKSPQPPFAKGGISGEEWR
jgi:hypothetical protein